MLIDENLQAGLSPAEARRLALARFGGLESVKESYRDRRGIPRLETLWQDVRYAVRSLRKNTGATLLGVLIMALGIGANTAVFSVVYAVLLNPLPYPNPERIVMLTYVSNGGSTSSARLRQVSAPDVRDWRSESTSFDAMAYFAGGRAPVMAGPVAKYATVMRVSGEFFRAFAVQPAVGRSFNQDESRSGRRRSSAIDMLASSSATPRARSGRSCALAPGPFPWWASSRPHSTFPWTRTSGFRSSTVRVKRGAGTTFGPLRGSRRD